MSIQFDNPFETCKCKDACGHSGKNHHSYMAAYAEVLYRARAAVVLEWGPGANTFMALATPAIEVHSVEHNPKWIPPVIGRRVCFHQIPLTDKTQYKRPIDTTIPGVFFVDSAMREEILAELFLAAPVQSVVCLHDAQRERYHENLRLFPYVKFLAKGFAIASKSAEIMGIERVPA